MYGEQYKHLSNDAKLAYMVLKDRLEYSLRNNWVDSEGHVYFIFTNQELMDFNPKTKKNEPNRLYLSKLDVKATDVYLRGKFGQKSSQTLATSGSSKNGLNLYKEPKDKDRYNIDTQKLDFSTPKP
ncbi:Replication initiator protein [Latilactobacillus curvatus]|nr:Replication initiator protein [Latilactobacillus curvatus]